MASTLSTDLAQGGGEQAHTDFVVGLAVVGPDHHLDAPRVVAAAQLGVADQGAVGRFSSNEPGEAGATPVDEVEPFVLTERVVPVGDEGLMQELRDLGDVGLAHPALDLDGVHGRRLPPLRLRPRAGPVRSATARYCERRGTPPLSARPGARGGDPPGQGVPGQRGRVVRAAPRRRRSNSWWRRSSRRSAPTSGSTW